MLRRVLLAALAAAVTLVGVVGVRTLTFTGDAPPVMAASSVVVRPGAAERLAGAIRIPTLTSENTASLDAVAFAAFRDYLREQFPVVHGTLSQEPIGDASLLFTWAGSDPGAETLLLAGHMDVVPVEAGTERRWTFAPFSGAIADGFVWGRGTVDDKSSVLAILEAVEALATRGFRPRRTIYLAFGHDEETGGEHGAARIAAVLAERRVRIGLVLDEGGVIADGMFPGVSAPVALIGVAEKGAVTVEVAASSAGGHASMPPSRTSIGTVSAAVVRLEQQQMPARFEGPTRSLFERLGPRFPFGPRMVFANLWLTEPFLLRQLTASPATNAAVRTTTAVTMFDAGVRPNVLAGQARAVVNFRILPGDSVDAVIAHVRRVVDDDTLTIAPLGPSWEPSAVSSTDFEGYHALERAVRQSMPEAVVAPYLVPGATDARHYRAIASHTYRFLPLRMTPADVDRLHGTNERVAIVDYERAIGIVQRLVADFAGASSAGVR